MSSNPQNKNLRFIIIGGGMAGILSAVKLKEAGYTNFTLYEKASSLGGTWRENQYPGVACDVPSHFYCYSFAPNPDWSYNCSPGAEIYEYLQSVADQFDVYPHVKFDTEIASMVFRNSRWHLKTNQGHLDEADFVIGATGVLHRPSYPDIPGIDSFEGTMFHTSRWNHSVPLEDKRIGIIGTGSTSIQIVGALSGKVKKLEQFQRTPQWIMPRPNPAYTEQEKLNFRENPALLDAIRAENVAISEGGFSSAVVGENPEALAMIAQLTLENLEQNVTDPVLREKLRPDYQAACKRLIMSHNYYDAIQHRNTELVTESITGIEPEGIRTADGKLHKLDVLVISTGFQVDQFLRPIEVTGNNGVTLEEAWKARPSAYLSVAIPEFPNLILLNGPNGPVGNFSLIDVADIQFSYFMKLVDHIQQSDFTQFVAKQDALDRTETDRVEATKKTVWVSGCDSWYLDDRGVPAAWPWSMKHFRNTMAEPDMSDYELAS
ncbi:MAG: NAD(P)/FAD-dependent oxidoreductase [Pseudomonadales bacterium]|nr:NAD(P)/FAD-dependent oxidoreductase [Pseudomonadales bacterium]